MLHPPRRPPNKYLLAFQEKARANSLAYGYCSRLPDATTTCEWTDVNGQECVNGQEGVEG